jgi:hypothetical protein
MNRSNLISQNQSVILQKYIQNPSHNQSNCSGPEAYGSVFEEDEESNVMIFPDNEISDEMKNGNQIQLRGKKNTTSNNSVMTNFNPLTALDTYENNNFDGH